MTHAQLLLPQASAKRMRSHPSLQPKALSFSTLLSLPAFISHSTSSNIKHNFYIKLRKIIGSQFISIERLLCNVQKTKTQSTNNGVFYSTFATTHLQRRSTVSAWKPQTREIGTTTSSNVLSREHVRLRTSSSNVASSAFSISLLSIESLHRRAQT